MTVEAKSGRLLRGKLQFLRVQYKPDNPLDIGQRSGERGWRGGFRVQGCEIMVQGQGLGCRVYGLGVGL